MLSLTGISYAKIVILALATLNGSNFGESVRSSLYSGVLEEYVQICTSPEDVLQGCLGFAIPILCEVLFSYGCSLPILLVFLVANIARGQLRELDQFPPEVWQFLKACIVVGSN